VAKSIPKMTQQAKLLTTCCRYTTALSIQPQPDLSWSSLHVFTVRLINQFNRSGARTRTVSAIKHFSSQLLGTKYTNKMSFRRREANMELQPLTMDYIDQDLSPNLVEQAPPSPLAVEANSKVNRVNHWRNHPYAVGLVHPTWDDELSRSISDDYDSDTEANGANRFCCADSMEKEMDPTCGCLAFSGFVCGRLGFKRIGNMILISEKVVGEEREIQYTMGPYWPMLCFVTYPLILVVSFWTATSVVFVSNFQPLIVCAWSALTIGLCLALFFVSCTDPGILKKHSSIPEGQTSAQWRWVDRVQSYVPRGAMYDPDCAVVVEQFDHTCPWTGTAIGKKNMPAFQAFIALLFTCLIMDIILLTSASII
jgi:hypothetical protein